MKDEKHDKNVMTQAAVERYLTEARTPQPNALARALDRAESNALRQACLSLASSTQQKPPAQSQSRITKGRRAQ